MCAHKQSEVREVRRGLYHSNEDGCNKVKSLNVCDDARAIVGLGSAIWGKTKVFGGLCRGGNV